MTAPDSFDPFSAPAPDDLPARATRLATACAVVSMLAATSPSPVLRANLHEGSAGPCATPPRWPAPRSSGRRPTRAHRRRKRTGASSSDRPP